MTSRRLVYVHTESDDSLSLRFPYAGRNYGHLFVIQHPRFGLMVQLKIDKGQLVCEPGGCRVLVRFDEREPTYFGASEPADRSSNVLFLNEPSRFVAEAKKAKRIRVQANIYQEGAPYIEFTPTPLEWPWPKQAGQAASAPPGRMK